MLLFLELPSSILSFALGTLCYMPKNGQRVENGTQANISKDVFISIQSPEEWMNEN